MATELVIEFLVSLLFFGILVAIVLWMKRMIEGHPDHVKQQIHTEALLQYWGTEKYKKPVTEPDETFEALLEDETIEHFFPGKRKQKKVEAVQAKKQVKKTSKKK